MKPGVNIIFFSFIISMIVISCAPAITNKLTNKSYNALSQETVVYVLEEDEDVPDQSELIGEIKVGDSGFTTDCGYDKILSEARNTARNSGANIVKITKIKRPDMLSTCYRIVAKTYRNLDEKKLERIKKENKGYKY